MTEVMKIMATSFKRAQAQLQHSVPPTLKQATADPHLRWRLLDTRGHSGPASCVITAPFSWVLVCTRFCVCPPRVSPVLVQWFDGGVNVDLLQEALCHTQVCCTQRPCPCGSPLQTHTSTGTLKQFCLSLCGVSRSWCAYSLFEPSEHL